MQATKGTGTRDIHEVLRSHWGYDSFRPMQEQVIRSILEGRDTLALMPTGGGKSLCYQVPALAMGRLCLVISPLIALMKDQVERLRAQGIQARAVVSGMSRSEMDNAMESAAVGRLSFLYLSPERLATDLFKARVERMPIGLIAVDEAHCISQWGYDFRPSYMRIVELREQVPHAPILALTATATKEVAEDIVGKLGLKAPRSLRASFSRPELVFWVSRGEDKFGRLIRILQGVQGSAIIYLRDRRGTVRLARSLSQQGIPTEPYHAGLSVKDRDRVQKQWTTGALRCVAATNAFGMGIDKSDVRAVIHMDLPPDLESYYQEAGRAGRDGKPAYAFLLIAPGDIERTIERSEQGFPSLTEVRRVYQAFSDLNGIAMGSGLQETYTVDLEALSIRTGSRPLTVANALKTLELDGRIALSSGYHSPSRALIIANHSVVHSMRVADGHKGPLLEALLRLYGGLFEEPSMIDEGRLAKLTGWSVGTVEQRLRALDEQGVLSYHPRNDMPTATLLQPRQDAGTMVIDPIALSDRRRRARERMDAMVAYVIEEEQCRSRMVLSYFDEPGPSDCGQCDVCKRIRGHGRTTVVGDTSVSEGLLERYDEDVYERRVDLDEGIGKQ